MKSAVETLNPTRVKLTVEVPFEELKPSLDAAYKKIAQQISIPGFRKGKVPAMVIDQRVGREAVIEEAVNEALPRLYFQALQENNIVPLGQPELDLDDVAGRRRPQVHGRARHQARDRPARLRRLEVEVDDVDVDDDEVDEQLETCASASAASTPVERAAADGDFVTIDLSAAKDGEPIEEAQATGMSYQVGRGTMLEGLDDALDRHVRRATRRRSSPRLVGGEFKDQSVDVTVKVTAVKEQELPDLDDDFAQQASEFDTIDELQGRPARPPHARQAGWSRPAPRVTPCSRSSSRMVEIPLARQRRRRRAEVAARLDRAAARVCRHVRGRLPRVRRSDRGGVRG